MFIEWVNENLLFTVTLIVGMAVWAWMTNQDITKEK